MDSDSSSESTVVPTSIVVPPQESNPCGIPTPEARYIYYQVYNGDGPVRSKKPVVGTCNPYIGRVDATQIPPPHTANSLIFIITKTEGIDLWMSETLGTFAVLSQTLSSAEPFGAFQPLPLVSDHRIGSTPRDPVIVKICDFNALDLEELEDF